MEIVIKNAISLFLALTGKLFFYDRGVIQVGDLLIKAVFISRFE